MKKYLFFVILFSFYNVFSQSVSGTVSINGCKNGGTITATSTGFGGNVLYQLRNVNNFIIAPVTGDSNAFTSNPVFNGLGTDIYLIKAKSDTNPTIYTSTDINVNNGYVNMSCSVPFSSIPCPSAMTSLTATVTGGNKPYVYSITDSSNNVIQTSSPEVSKSFTFNNLGVGNYTVNITDSCSQTTIQSTSVSAPIASVNQIGTSGTNYAVGNTTTCGSFNIFIQGGFNKLGISLKPEESALFKWKFKLNGVEYGQQSGGYMIPGGAGFGMQSTYIRGPLLSSTQDLINNISTAKIVVYDQCNNTKELPFVVLVGRFINTVTCDDSYSKAAIDDGLGCYPITIDFKNTVTNEVTTITQTSSQPIRNLTPGATYNVTYVDGQGRTSDILPNKVTFPLPLSSFTTQQLYSINNGYNRNALNRGYLHFLLNVNPNSGSKVTYEILASSNTAEVPIGTTGEATSSGTNEIIFSDNFPKGTYSVKTTIICSGNPISSTSTNIVVRGYTASITGYETSIICGGFNYKMKTVLDDYLNYEVVILSGPSNVGVTKNFLNANNSDTFSGLALGDYTFGLRIRGSNTTLLSQNINFLANNVITIDKANSGGVVCNSGDTNAVLRIYASSISPLNNLEYRLSLNGGVTYGAWQTSNTFNNLSNKNYTYQVKDGCGYIVTEVIRIVVASDPVASADKIAVCELNPASTPIKLYIDIPNAKYLWTGPGINATNNTLRSPTVFVSDLALDANTYTVSVELGVIGDLCYKTASTSINITKKRAVFPGAIGIPDSNVSVLISSQKTINTNLYNNAILALESTKKAFVITRVNNAEVSIKKPVEGMFVFDTNSNCFKLYNDSSWNCIAQTCKD